MRFAQLKPQEGTDLDTLAGLVTNRQREYLTVPMSELTVNDLGQIVHNNFALNPTKTAAQRLGGRIGIPASYVAKAPTNVMAYNFNQFLPTAQGHVMLAIEDGDTLVGVLRQNATVVPSDLLLEELESRNRGMDLAKWVKTEQGFEVRFASKNLGIEPRPGDIIKAGVDLTNFENTLGGLDVNGSMYREICSNGLRVPILEINRRLRHEHWREPAALVNTAMGTFQEAVQKVVDFGDSVKSLVDFRFELPTDGDARERVLKRPMRIVGLPSRLSDSVVTSMQEEEPTLYGFHNALTRLGRDAGPWNERPMFEQAGYKVALKRDDVVTAYRDAVEAL